MDAAAGVSSGGRVTVPKIVRDALALEEDDTIHFRVDGDRAQLTRSPDFVELAGTISVPAGKRNVGWVVVIARTRAVRAHSDR